MLVVSASMGGGHDGAARELCRRLAERGWQARMVDFLQASPVCGRLLRWGYTAELRAAPWTYEATYRVWAQSFLARPLVVVLALAFGRRMRRWAAELGADAVVTTYPLASVALGHDRQRGRLAVPVVTFVTDFAVHPLWVHPGVDLNLCVHQQAADQAARATGRPARAPGPLVAEAFRRPSMSRSQARAAFGLPPDARVVLVVAGSWGVGELEETFDSILASGRYLPVAVCGANERLRRRLVSRHQGVALGWTDQMATLMVAADVLVENAGGLTCMEAFSVGLPVVSFRPIPGHGRQNALEMDKAGVSVFVSAPGQLIEVLDQVTTLAGRRMVDAGTAMFRADPTDEIMELLGVAVPAAAGAAGPGGAEGTPVGGRTTRARVLPPGTPSRSRRLVRLGVAAASVYAGLNLAADAATAHGLGVAHPQAHVDAIYLGLMVGPGNAGGSVPALLARDHVTAIVNGQLARTDPSAVRRLMVAGVEVANGGWGDRDLLHLLQVGDGVDRATHVIHLAGYRCCRDYAPQQGVNGSDLALATIDHERIVHPTRVVAVDAPLPHLSAGRIYVVDGTTASAGALEERLGELTTAAQRQDLTTAPFASLR